MPADLPDLEAAIRSTSDVCFFADKSPATPPVELETIATGQATGPPRLEYFIVRRHRPALNKLLFPI